MTDRTWSRSAMITALVRLCSTVIDRMAASAALSCRRISPLLLATLVSPEPRVMSIVLSLSMRLLWRAIAFLSRGYFVLGADAARGPVIADRAPWRVDYMSSSRPCGRPAPRMSLVSGHRASVKRYFVLPSAHGCAELVDIGLDPRSSFDQAAGLVDDPAVVVAERPEGEGANTLLGA